MSTVWNWIKQHWLKTLLITLGILLALITPPFIVHAMYKTVARNPYFESTWSSGDLITYIAGFEAFIGTVFLGIVAMWQNDKANSLNKIMLDNEEKHRKFERQPSLMLYNWEFASASDDKIFRNIYPIFNFDESLFYSSIIDYARLYILNITFINSSKVFTEFEVDHFRVFQNSDDGEYIDYSNTPLSCKQETFHIAPMKEVTFGFVLHRDFFTNCIISRASFGITMRNSIGELYSEIIEFSIAKGDIVFREGYYIIPLPDNIDA